MSNDVCAIRARQRIEQRLFNENYPVSIVDAVAFATENLVRRFPFKEDAILGAALTVVSNSVTSNTAHAEKLIMDRI